MLVQCNKCGLKIDSEAPEFPGHFYLKYKDKAPTVRSSWCSHCAECQKNYKKQWYTENKEWVLRGHKTKRLQNYDQYLEKEAARRLKNASNPEAILQRRVISSMDEETRYIHDRSVQWKASARKRGLTWGLTEDCVLDILKKQSGLCFYSGRKLVLAPNSVDTLSLDRIDSSFGYLPDNVVLCTHWANLMKVDNSISNFRSMVQDLYRMFEGPREDLGPSQ